MREDFWENTFELPCPEERGEVKVFGQLVERNVVTDGDTSLIGYLEVGCRPIAGVSFAASFGDRYEVFCSFGCGEVFALFDVVCLDFFGKGFSGFGVDQLVADFRDEGGVAYTDNGLPVVRGYFDRCVRLACGSSADE